MSEVVEEVDQHTGRGNKTICSKTENKKKKVNEEPKKGRKETEVIEKQSMFCSNLWWTKLLGTFAGRIQQVPRGITQRTPKRTQDHSY